MSRYTFLSVALLTLTASSVLSAGDYFSGIAPKEAVLALDKRSELEVLQDQVDEMAFYLEESLYLIDAHEQKIAALESTIEEQLQYSSDLQSMITMSGSTITLTAARINLATAHVDADGLVECTTIKTQNVVSKNYTPGAGNVW